MPLTMRLGLRRRFQRYDAEEKNEGTTIHHHEITRLKLTTLAAVLFITFEASNHLSAQVVAWNGNTVPEGVSNVVKIAAGETHCLALTREGQIVAWGENGYGQLNVPQAAGPFKAIAAGYYHSVAVKTNGTVVAFGKYKQVPPGLSNVVAVAAGWKHSLALRSDGQVVGWAEDLSIGIDNYGQERVPTDLRNVVAIDAIHYRSVALTADGKVVVWGGVTWQGTSMQPPADLTNAIAIAASDEHILALTSEGAVVSWGSFLGETNVPPGLAQVRDIYAGYRLSMAVGENGSFVAWGNTNGLPTHPPNVQSVSARNNILALAANGPPSVTSSPLDRQLPQGSRTYFRVTASGGEPLTYQWRFKGENLAGATNAVLTLSNIQLHQSGAYSVVVRNADGEAISPDSELNVTGTWLPLVFTVQPTNISTYMGASAQLYAAAAGSGPISYQWKRDGTNIPGASSTDLFFEKLGLADNGSYSLVASNGAGVVESEPSSLSVGLVAGWTSGHFPNARQAIALPPGLSNAVAVSARDFHSMALKEDGTVVDWGLGSSAPPPGLKDVVAIAAGGAHSLALKSDGTVVAWGNGTSGQTIVPRGLTNVVAIAAGGAASLALTSDGVLFSWGALVCQVNGLTNIAAMAVSSSEAITASRDGELVQWADPPIKPQHVTNVVALAASDSVLMALLADGRTAMAARGYYGWGFPPPGNYVAIAAGATEHLITVTLDPGGTVRSVWGPFSSWPDAIGIAAGTDHILAVLRNPEARQTLRVGFVSHEGDRTTLKVNGARGAKPVIVEASTNLSAWQRVSTNWLNSTASQMAIEAAPAEVKYFRALQP